VIVVVVVVVVVVGGLFAAGVLKLSSGGGGGSATTYTVTFSEMGLTTGASWTVTLNGVSHTSTTNSMTFSESNGTYAFTVTAVVGYSAVPSTGTVVVNGAAAYQSITFTKIATYSVVFSETGLASGTSWTVTLGGVPQSSTTSTTTFTEPNGSYAFSVTAVGYSAAPASGTISVNGIAASQAIAFTRATTYTVTFAETGLGLGGSWSVTLNSVPQSSTATSIPFTGLVAGSYSFLVTASGYTANPASGSVTVANTNVTKAITFTSSGGGGNGESYSQAEATAASAANGYSGGGWSLEIGVAVAVPTASTVPSSALEGPVSGCPVINWIGTQPATIAVAATSTSAPTGFAAVWVFYFDQTSTQNVLSVGVSGGTATLFFATSGCGFPGAPSTTGFIDSPQAVTVANANGGSAFLSSHSVALQQFIIQAALPEYSSGSWNVTYSTCAVSQTTGSGVEFNAEVNATSGALISTDTNSVFCTGPGQSTYTVSFSETGLGSGASWTVIFNSVTESSSGTSLQYPGITNGEYSFSVTATGYTADPASGTVTVANANVLETITFTSSGPPGGNGQTYSQAEATAAAAASGYSGGGWIPAIAFAFALPSAISMSTGLANFTESCPGSWIGSEPSSIEIPATSSSAPPGASAAWFFYFGQASTGSVLVADVLSGTATLLYSGTGGNECATFSVLTAVGIVDSSVAVSVANTNGGSAFLSTYPDALRTFEVVGGYVEYGFYPAWNVTYDNCGVSQTSGTALEFSAVINATNGDLISTSTGMTECTSTPAHATASAFSQAAPRAASSSSAALAESRRAGRST
jgi:hypothetical protein